jgi:hypothetical protein
MAGGGRKRPPANAESIPISWTDLGVLASRLIRRHGPLKGG